MTINIDEIIIKHRIRKDNGDITLLTRSLKRHGQLQPIVLNDKMELLAGYRRIQAARQAGWKTIEARIVNSRSKLEKLEIEIEENTTRKPFEDEELYEAHKKLDRLRKGGFFTRIGRFLKRLLRKR